MAGELTKRMVSPLLTTASIRSSPVWVPTSNISFPISLGNTLVGTLSPDSWLPRCKKYCHHFWGRHSPSFSQCRIKMGSRNRSFVINGRERRVVGNGGDRFIPSRLTSNFELGHHKVQCKSIEKKNITERVDLSKRIHQSLLQENIFDIRNKSQKVFGYQNMLPTQTTSFRNPLFSYRKIDEEPDQILNAAGIHNNFYVNVADWHKDSLAIGLNDRVCIRNQKTLLVDNFIHLEDNHYATSVTWVRNKSEPYLAIGTSYGQIEIWDCVKKQRVQTIKEHYSRVESLSYSSNVLSSGCRLGQIVHHDMRQAHSCIGRLKAHTTNACSIKWSPSGQYLASGGGDNKLKLWPHFTAQNYSRPEPIYSFDEHRDTVKPIAWCPWSSHIIASGGDLFDGTIKIWNTNTGLLSKSVETNSQVCSLLWSPTRKELVSGHGFIKNNLILWKYPRMNKIIELEGHTGLSQISSLHLTSDTTTVVSVGTDEDIKFWTFFPRKKKEPLENSSIISCSAKLIR